MTPQLAEAAAFLAAHWPVFPCLANKRPATKHGFLDAVAEPEAARRMFSAEGVALIGVPTGPRSGLAVVDLDVKNGAPGLEWFAANERRLPRTRRHKTRSGGVHLLFRYPADRQVRNSAGRIAPGVDIRGDGGYVIFPPSPGYTVEDDAMPAEMPAWLLDLIDPPRPPATAPVERRPTSSDGTRYGLAALQRECGAIITAPDGAKHDTLNRAAYSIGGLVAAGELDERAAFDALRAALATIRHRCEDYAAAERTLKGAFEDGIAAPRQPPQPWPEPRRLNGAGHTPRTDGAPREAGSTDPSGKPQAQQAADVFPTLGIDEILALPPPDWLVHGLLTTEGNALLYGPFASLKSFVTLDIALSVAYGRPWQGREVKQCGVLYIAGEGARGIGRRILAWQLHHGLETVDAPFRLLHVPINLTNDEHVARLVRTAKAQAKMEGNPIGLVVIDTLARAIVGADENSAQDMGRAIRATDEIREEARTATLTVHHTGKDGDRGPRGSSALGGAADTLLRVERSDLTVTITIEKQKEDEEGQPITLEAKKVPLGAGENAPTSLVLVEGGSGSRSARPSGRLSGDQQAALRVLHDALAECGEVDFPGVPSGVRSIPEGWWRDRFYSRCKPGADPETRKKAFRRAADALCLAGLVATNRGRVWAT